ncbi:hypothetical protein SAMN05518672_102398 [Chitinophaga sp. CF118]|uniref:hypothetical protein n=1 Tax=Chitinophaga sp. CF118 TaxID=1884367 RepID=UPI0008E9CAB1|nr:hypothetical protein [Chitinophaga sp. CF118]SFD55272.1 hypothetical protein SAMN05518672_102398 [Chitinophaga sp. CF118]
MKNYIILSLLVLASALVSCTKEDAESLPGSSIAKSNLKFSVTQEQGHDNIVMVSSLTQGSYTPYWQVAGISTKKQIDTLTVPFGGTYMLNYSIYTSGGPLADSMQITVSENDPFYFSNKSWNLLTNGQQGKTWVWAVDRPTGICYGNGSGAAVAPEWWQNGIAYLTTEGVADDEMTFNLNGAKNFTFTHAGATKAASFDLDTLKQTVKITGSDISLGNKVTYVIVKLTEDELTLAQQGDGWRNLWLFKRKGYTYP